MAIVTFLAREQITVSNTAIGADNGGTLLTANIKGRLLYANLQVQAQQVRATFDGSTAPVGLTTGELWAPSDIKRIWGLENIENLSMIRDSADATVVVTYWGGKA